MHYITGMHSYGRICTVKIVCTVMAVYALYYWYAQLWPYMHCKNCMHCFGRICPILLVCTVMAVYSWYAQLMAKKSTWNPAIYKLKLAYTHTHTHTQPTGFKGFLEPLQHTNTHPTRFLRLVRPPAGVGAWHTPSKLSHRGPLSLK